MSMNNIDTASCMAMTSLNGLENDEPCFFSKTKRWKKVNFFSPKRV